MDLFHMFIVAEVILGIFTMIGNTIVVVAIVRTKSLHTTTNIFISSLATADIAVGLFVPPCSIATFVGWPHYNPLGCIFVNSVVLMFTNISIFMMLIIIIDRFVAIKFPFAYIMHVNPTSAIQFSAAVWIAGIFLGSLPMLGWNIAPDTLYYCRFFAVISKEYMVYFQFATITLFPMIIMLIVYIYLFIIVRQHTKENNKLVQMFCSPQSINMICHRLDKDVEAAKMFALLFFVFALCWLPINISNTIQFYCPSMSPSFEFIMFAILLSHANSCINPFLYAINNSQIKIAIIKLCTVILRGSAMTQTQSLYSSNQVQYYDTLDSKFYKVSRVSSVTSSSSNDLSEFALERDVPIAHTTSLLTFLSHQSTNIDTGIPRYSLKITRSSLRF